jgi:hypothetical protein
MKEIKTDSLSQDLASRPQTVGENVELDARIVLACMRGGMDGLVNWAFMNRNIFKTPNDAIERANWLKTQPADYINSVSKRAAELEKL